MTEAEKLTMLKADLELMTSVKDAYLKQLLTLAASDIETEGIIIDASEEAGMLVVLYAAYLYRKRASDNPVMPRFLRRMLNNRLLKQKASHDVW